LGIDENVAQLINETFHDLEDVFWGKQGNLLVSDCADGKIYRISNLKVCAKKPVMDSINKRQTAYSVCLFIEKIFPPLKK